MTGRWSFIDPVVNPWFRYYYYSVSVFGSGVGEWWWGGGVGSYRRSVVLRPSQVTVLPTFTSDKPAALVKVYRSDALYSSVFRIPKSRATPCVQM